MVEADPLEFTREGGGGPVRLGYAAVPPADGDHFGDSDEMVIHPLLIAHVVGAATGRSVKTVSRIACGGLVLNGGDRLAAGFLLGLDHANCLAIDEESVVGGAGVAGILADSLPLTGEEVNFVLRLKDPARRPELRVNCVAGYLFGIFD